MTSMPCASTRPARSRAGAGPCASSWVSGIVGVMESSETSASAADLSIGRTSNSLRGMPSSPPPKRVRKTPEARRAEIVAKAAEIALAEGLEIITLRRIADELGVRPGLIRHYFPVAEDLPSEAFGTAASAELDQLIPGGGGAGAGAE